MSKTYRSVPHYAQKCLNDNKVFGHNKSVARLERIIRGQDGACKSVLGSISNNKPKGYDNWDEVWGEKGKRDTKNQTTKILRNRAKNEAVLFLGNEE